MPLRKPAPTVPLDQAAPASEPQQFHDTLAVDFGIAQTWETPHGPIAVVHPTIERSGFRWRAWAEQFHWCRAVIVVSYGMNMHGNPDLFVHDLTMAGDGFHYELDWSELNALIGQAAPYWAPGLRTVTGMANWRPGEPQRTVAAEPEIDMGAVLRLAARHAPETAIHVTLMDFARRMLARAEQRAVNDVAFVREHQSASAAIVFAAVPAATYVAPEPLDPAVVKAGWLHVLDLADDDAFAALIALERKGEDSRVLPASTVASIAGDEPGAAEWIARLEPTVKTARFAMFNEHQLVTPLIDPLTQSVVAHNDEGAYWAAVPSRLPTSSPLAGVELWPGRVWIRCEDGTKYLCPETGSVDVNWGYNGGGPLMLANVLHALLDDINADIAGKLLRAPAALERFCERPWEPGTVLTRDQLERTRRG